MNRYYRAACIAVVLILTCGIAGQVLGQNTIEFVPGFQFQVSTANGPNSGVYTVTGNIVDVTGTDQTPGSTIAVGDVISAIANFGSSQQYATLEITAVTSVSGSGVTVEAIDLTQPAIPYLPTSTMTISRPVAAGIPGLVAGESEAIRTAKVNSALERAAQTATYAKDFSTAQYSTAGDWDVSTDTNVDLGKSRLLLTHDAIGTTNRIQFPTADASNVGQEITVGFRENSGQLITNESFYWQSSSATFVNLVKGEMKTFVCRADTYSITGYIWHQVN